MAYILDFSKLTCQNGSSTGYPVDHQRLVSFWGGEGISVIFLRQSVKSQSCTNLVRSLPFTNNFYFSDVPVEVPVIYVLYSNGQLR